MKQQLNAWARCPTIKHAHLPSVPGSSCLEHAGPTRFPPTAPPPAPALVAPLPSHTDTAVDPSLRPEEFTRQKEERQKAMGVDIITVDPNYRPEGASAERYQPKVTTWGVFPRPNNISEAYGGGRTIKPGEALETPEQKKKREVWRGGVCGGVCAGGRGVLGMW